MSPVDLLKVKSSRPSCAELTLLMLVSFALTWTAGCHHRRNKIVLSPADCEPCQTMLQNIDYPDLVDESGLDGSDLMSAPPTTISNFHELEPWDLTIDECVTLTLANSKVLQKLGGVVVNAPGAATTLYDQALIETNPNQSVEAALSDFDAQFSSSLFLNRNQRFGFAGFGPGNPPIPIIGLSTAHSSNFLAEFSKLTATGATFSYRNITDYSRNNPQRDVFESTWNTVNQMEFRQPLGRGAGTTVNRIAGPNAAPGIYNGVLIARIRSDISLSDFEASVRDLVRDVVNSYWELQFGYRNLDTILTSREYAREVWLNRKLRLDADVGRPDDEAIARQNFINFENRAQNALVGVPNGELGVLGAERNLRRLMGLPVQDGRLIRPITEPTVAPILFDWQESQQQALARRVEVRRQKWTIRQRELELLAAKQLNKWRLDMVGLYGFRGFGDNLFGSRSRPNGSAFDDLINGRVLDDWQVGLEFGGPIGNRTGHLAIRNAELSLVRERTLLREQQRQVLQDLGSAFTEVDRAHVAMRTSFNSQVAVKDELGPKEKRVLEGQDQVFFLLDAQQRDAAAESAVHRAVADYNQALMNYTYTTGSLLKRYNVVLTEGPWSEDAQVMARVKAKRFKTCPDVELNSNKCPVAIGEYEQQANGPNAEVLDLGQKIEGYYQRPSNRPFDNSSTDRGPEAGIEPVEDDSLAPRDSSDLDYYSGDGQ